MQTRMTELQMRCLKNEISRRVLEIEAGHGTFNDILPYMIGERSKEAWNTGDVEMAPLAVGQSIGLIKEVMNCADLLDWMVKEAKAILGRY